MINHVIIYYSWWFQTFLYISSFAAWDFFIFESLTSMGLAPPWRSRNGWALELLGEKLKAEREIVKEAITQEGGVHMSHVLNPCVTLMCSCLGRGPLQGCGVSKTLVSVSQRKLRVRQDMRVSNTCVRISKT